MKIYLVRHTETILDRGICYGKSDILIKEPYLEEFKIISDTINEKSFNIYSSPLKRCTILAEFLNQLVYNPENIRLDNRLKEMNFGEWELMKWDDINAEQLKEWGDDFVNKSVPKGESFQQLSFRVIDFINSELFHQPADKPLVIVTHAGVIRCILCYINNISLKDAFNNSVTYGQVIKLNISASFILLNSN